MIKYCYYDANGKPTSEVITAAQWKKVEKLYHQVEKIDV